MPAMPQMPLIPMKPRFRPEVLAPVGSPACLPAAVAGGADAVYFGMRHFNARGRAENFRTAELAHHVDWLHGHGVKCYVVMNTLVHDDEYPKALTLARAAVEAGVDAAIIQDLGLWDVLSREFPQLKRHASTQMTIHDPAQVAVLARLGAERVILARELALSEVQACTDAAREMGIETEHFVHGALCYAFSGQCLMSNFAGCRSANRGTCAQNCRFDYQVEERTETVLSMRDFALVDQIGALATAGVASLKIEGRLKTPEYVFTVAGVYRAAVDAWVAGAAFDALAARTRLREVFARSFTDAPLAGIYDERSRLHRWEPDKDAPADAILESLDRAQSRAMIAAPQVQAGMGFTYTHGMWNGGFLVIAADSQGPGRWRCRIRGDAEGPPLPKGLALRKNVDHARRAESERAMAAVRVPPAPPRAVAVDLHVSGSIGSALHVACRSADGRSCVFATVELLQAARGVPLDAERLRESLGAFGGSGFRCGALTTDLEPGSFVPASALKQLRRELVAELEKLPVQPAPAPWAPPDPGQPRRRQVALWVAVGSLAAARMALAAGAAAVWLEDATLDLWAADAPSLDHTDIAPGLLWLRHPATARTSPHLARLGLPVVAGQLGVVHAAHAAGLAVIADHPCNVFGWATLRALGGLGVQAAVVSLECSAREVARLAGRIGATTEPMPAVGVVVHGRLPAMLTRQDHGLAVGAQQRIRAAEHDGGLPYAIQRRAGGDTVIWEERRLCVPEQAAQTAHLVDGWVLECADLDPDSVAVVTAAYRDLRDGYCNAEAVRERTRPFASNGFFAGHLERGSRELDAAAASVES